MLARTGWFMLLLFYLDTNVIRREYRNPDSEDEEGDDLYSGP